MNPVRTLMLLAVSVAMSGNVRAQADDFERADGPTDLSVILGNGRLTAGANALGVFTVLRWPSPTEYEHLRHITTPAAGDDPRALPRLGALPTDGLVTGVIVDWGDGPRV